MAILMTRTADGALVYDDVGHGEPALLYLNGWGANRGIWQRLVAQTSQRRRTLALDWRGHGASSAPTGDFGADELVDDALAVIAASGAREVVPVANAHAGWMAIALRRRLGQRIPKLVLVDWIVLDPPAPFLAALQAMQDPQRWQQARDGLVASWLQGVEDPAERCFVREHMGTVGFELWARAGREIAAAYAREGNPLTALAELDPPAPALHLYGTPDDPGFLAAQQAFAAAHPWFSVRKVHARTHFPMFAAAEEIATEIERFVG